MKVGEEGMGEKRKQSKLSSLSVQEMLGISPEVIIDRLNVDPHHKPGKQKRRSLGMERNLAIEAEVWKFLEAGFIRECHLGCECGNGKDVQWGMENVCGLHRSQQSLSQRQLPVVKKSVGW